MSEIMNGNKAIEKINELKKQWSQDPCWDIEDTEGFEDYHEELTAYRKHCEATWEKERQENLERVADSLGCPGNIKIASAFQGLLWRIEQLENKDA